MPIFRRASRFAVAFSTMILLLAAISFSESSGKHVLHDGWRQVEQKPNQNVNGDRGGYVGSKVCAQCHAPIASKYSRTDMGRSMSEVTASLLEKIPNSASLVDDRLKKHFDLYVKDGTLLQSEYERSSDGNEASRETHALNWIIGSGANGL